MALDPIVGAYRHQSEFAGPVRLTGRIERAAPQVGMRRDVVPGEDGDAEVVDLHVCVISLEIPAVTAESSS